MAEGDEELERRVRKLRVEHAETRWLALRLDDDVKELTATVRAVDTRIAGVEDTQLAHTGRFDSLDMQMRSLTTLLCEVLKRLPEPPDNGDQAARVAGPTAPAGAVSRRAAGAVRVRRGARRRAW